MIDLQRQGEVFVLRMDSGENRFSSAMIRAFQEALDEVEGASGPRALVTTGTGKFYTNGLDVEEMTSADVDAGEYVGRVLAIFERILLLPMITVAAVNGHAFGAGGQVIMAHDFRLMRSDRGFFCMPEVDMRLPLHPGMSAILAARIPAQTLHEVVVTGKRFGGEEAAARGIVDEAVTEAELLERAIGIAAPLATKADPILRTLRQGLYGPVLAALKSAPPTAG